MNQLWNQIAGGVLSDAQLSQLDRYLDLLIEKNEVINLTRITDRADAELKHVADALTLLQYLKPPVEEGAKPLHLADVGTGGGIPGIILAIARPDIQVTLIDATRKKLEAVMEMSDKIGLTNVRAVHTRMESIGERFDMITARGVAELDKLLTWCERLMKRSSVFLALKGPKLDEEISRINPGNKKVWTVVAHEVTVPELAGHRIAEATVRKTA